jgi:hypothetical protein
MISLDQRAASKYLSATTPSHLQRRWKTYRRLGSGSPTRGWKVAFPQRGTERHQLMAACGPQCFLQPAREAFPICAKLTRDRRNACVPVRQGVQSAYNRARQWGYKDVAKRARALLDRAC